MQKSQIELLALIGAVAASALALMLPVPYAWVTSISGFALLFTLFSYQGEGERSPFQSLAFSSACGLAVMLLSDIFYRRLGGNGEIHMAGDRIETVWLPVTWLGATLAIWAIDRVRLGRAGVATRPDAVQRSFIPQYAEPVQAQPTTFSAPVVPAAASQPVPAEVPTPPVAATTAPQGSAPAPAPLSPTAPAPTPVLVKPPVAAPSAPPLPQTEIYVSLIGEGLNLMRTVRAEHLGRDFYKIIEEMPEGETWEYRPGQVVRCKKKNLSTGKGLVAFEEAPRAS